jgi:hypothetical protein
MEKKRADNIDYFLSFLRCSLSFFFLAVLQVLFFTWAAKCEMKRNKRWVWSGAAECGKVTNDEKSCAFWTCALEDAHYRFVYIQSYFERQFDNHYSIFSIFAGALIEYCYE